jgi:hypothetical protein
MIHLTYSGTRYSIDIERSQIVATASGVFLRITTRAQEIPPSMFAPIRETSRRTENRWQIDGLNFNLSCRNVEFVTVSRRPLTTQLLVDLYFPLNQAIDISFQQYTPSDGVFNEDFTGTARIAERQTGVFGNPATPNARARNHRPVAVANIPREMRELVSQDLIPVELEDTDEIADVNATTLNAPARRQVAPDITEIPTPPPEPQFLRRFNNLVTDDGLDE